MRLKGIKAKVERALIQDIMITHIICDKADQRICAARNQVPESLQGHPFSKWWIEKIDNWKDEVAKPY